MWKNEVKKIIVERISKGQCFSSGEIARDLRLNNPEVRFSITSLGEYVRNCFYKNQMPKYIGGEAVLMAPRKTEGLFGGPKGIIIFTFGPSEEATFKHNFEVEVPRLGNNSRRSRKPYQLKPLYASVKDGECIIPRKAIELLLGNTNTPVTQETRAYVFKSPSANCIFISFKLISDGGAYLPVSLWENEGKITFPLSGDYESLLIEVRSAMIVISL